MINQRKLVIIAVICLVVGCTSAVTDWAINNVKVSDVFISLGIILVVIAVAVDIVDNTIDRNNNDNLSL